MNEEIIKKHWSYMLQDQIDSLQQRVLSDGQTKAALLSIMQDQIDFLHREIRIIK